MTDISNLINDMKLIVLDYIKNEYRNYLKSNKILYIKQSNIHKVANSFYNDNIKNIKQEIRSGLREKYKDNYSSGVVENTILEIFNKSEDNIDKVIDEINYIQNLNFIKLEVPIINNSLNLNISNTDGYIIINYVKDNTNESLKKMYDKIIKYKFIYSINDIILDDINENNKINIIKNEINDKKKIMLGVYYLKNNLEEL
tara:strand:- start:901 stop:1500 length:600 start_codon:yes stop_codon:yes gene_type:complete